MIPASPIWHSVTCACGTCLRKDELFIGNMRFIPEWMQLFQAEEAHAGTT